jgi:hypothetical protein
LKRRWCVAMLAALAGSGLAVSCSLDLDESKIGRRDGGPFSPDGPFDPRLDGAIDPDSGFLSSTCTTNEDCVANDGCLRGKCDRRRCIYDVCRTACGVGTCDRNARTCSAPTTYKYRAGQFRIGAQLDCKGCAVAVYPWLVALTREGPVAFNIANPTIPTPPQVPITGLAFRPTQIVQSGGRVWFLGPGSGAGPSRYPIAYIDAPVDPFAPELVARSVTINSNRSSAEALLLFPRINAGAVFVGLPIQNFPSFFAEGNVDDNATFTATPVSGAVNTLSPVVVSGKRLLNANVVSGDAQLQLIDNIGTANPQALTAATFNSASLSNNNAFVASPEGAVTLFSGVHQLFPGPILKTVRVGAFFLIADENATFTVSPAVEVEAYTAGNEPAANAVVVGAGQAGLDAKMSVIAAAARELPAAQTSVQFVKRDPSGLVSDGAIPRRDRITTPITNIFAATASNGIAYIVAHDVAGAATVYVYDPGCAP